MLFLQDNAPPTNRFVALLSRRLAGHFSLETFSFPSEGVSSDATCFPMFRFLGDIYSSSLIVREGSAVLRKVRGEEFLSIASNKQNKTSVERCRRKVHAVCGGFCQNYPAFLLLAKTVFEHSGETLDRNNYG